MYLCGKSTNFQNFCQACKHSPDCIHTLPNPAPECTHGHHRTCCTKFTLSHPPTLYPVYSQGRTYPMKMFFSFFHFKNEKLVRIQKRGDYTVTFTTQKKYEIFFLHIYSFHKASISSHVAEYTSNYHFCKMIEHRFCWSYTT